MLLQPLLILSYISILTQVSGVFSGRNLTFLALGDWGGREKYPYTTPNQLAVARGISRVSSDFILAIGDNFYADGVTDVYDRRFRETWQEVYPVSLVGPRPWYVVAGNHDHRGNVSAEIEYMKHDVTRRWKYPNYYYQLKKYFVNSQDNEIIRVGILMIDTVILTGQWDHDEPQPLEGYHMLKGHQMKWIERELREMVNQKVDWIFVAGHYPIWSVGEHGGTRYLQENLLPLLNKYGVTMYLNGHDHSLQMIRHPGGMYDVTTGAGHVVDSTMKHEREVPSGWLKYHYPSRHEASGDSGGFVSVELSSASQGYVKYYDETGQILYSEAIVNQRNPNP